MAVDCQDEDDFGFDSADEADMIQAVEPVVNPNGSTKRKRDHHDTTVDLDANRIASKAERLDSSLADSPTLKLAENVLRNQFRLENFRLKQAQAITRILDGGSCVVVFPTGGGKSLCYQVPGVAFRELDQQSNARQGYAESGITIVVSPLIALMKDQVDALLRRGINAASLDSSKTSEEYLDIVNRIRTGSLDILYCAPERLNNEGFMGQMARVPGGVRLLAVDEAHCISEWGHAFRPDYLKVARFATEIGAERVVCLTATATPAVADDVLKAFDIPREGLFRTTTYRPNLRLSARSFSTKRESYPALVSFLKANPGPTIIYVTLQKHTEDLTTQLRAASFNVRHFHAGISTEAKTAAQDMFMKSNNMVIVATIAFGMGIDKANVRNVVHYDIPRSLEGYSQEIGRAGRDGLRSNCVLFMCAEDLHLRESFSRGDLPSKSSISQLFQAICKQKSTMVDGHSVIDGNLTEQSKTHDIRPTVLKSVYAQLELRFGYIRETTPRYSNYTYQELNVPRNDTSDAAEAIRMTVSKKTKWATVDVDRAARIKRLQRSEVVAKLNEWGDQGRIKLKLSGVVHMYRVLKDLPESAERARVTDELYAELQLREKMELDRAQTLEDIMTGSACFVRSLCEHFGDTLPDGRNECGHCTWCETHCAVPLIKPAPKAFDERLFQAILRAVPYRDDPRFLARIAFGITSPRITAERFSSSPIFGSMGDHEFMTLLARFTDVCGGDGNM